MFQGLISEPPGADALTAVQKHGTAVDGLTFVAVSRFVVANDLADQVQLAFQQRLGQVDHAKGFVSLQVLRGADDPREFWLMTEWQDEASFDAWHDSHAYRDAHQGIPRGLKLVKGAQVIRRLHKVAT